MSLLELMLEMEQRGWAKIEPNKPRRKLQPFSVANGEPKEWFCKEELLPFKEYLLCLLLGSEVLKEDATVHHLQCRTYYQALMKKLDVKPHQPAQFYIALLARHRQGQVQKGETDAEAAPSFHCDVEDLTGASAPAQAQVPDACGDDDSDDTCGEELGMIGDSEEGGNEYDLGDSDSDGGNESSGGGAEEQHPPLALAPVPAHAVPQERRRRVAVGPKRDMRNHPNSFQHGLFWITFREDTHGVSYTAHCPFHTTPGGRKCQRDTRINQPDAETVKRRLRMWCNLAIKHPVSNMADEVEVELSRQA